MKIIPFTFLLLLPFCFLISQHSSGFPIFVPVEIQNAIENGTRSINGKPGPNYWQNHSEYDIQAVVFPVERTLEGTATIVYTNNSPDPLNEIYFTLLYDITRTGNVRNQPIPASIVGEGMKIKELRIDGQSLNLQNRFVVFRRGTELRAGLTDLLEPGEKISIYIAWELDLLPDAGRIGFVDSTTCFTGYWYPKIAVFDDIDGWDTNPFLGMAEFYSDLSDMEVEITIPENYTVWATGTLQNAADIFPETIKNRWDEATDSDQTITIIGVEDRKAGVKMKSTRWQFKADKVPDFAFAFSNHYLWESTSYKTDAGKTRIHSIYPASSIEYCKKATDWQREIMEFFSVDLPGVPFPYPEFTSFFKPYPGGGMEFPMMANNGSFGSEPGMIALIAHEMYHMYVPFYIRINEEKYAWMDEGWADFMDVRALRFIEGTTQSEGAQVNQNLSLERDMGTMANLPLITSTEYSSGDNYGFSAYTHPAFIYGLLEDALGTETFKNCLKGYMERWKYKSPTPYDFFYSFNDIAGQDLSWFWDPWFIQFGYPDLAISRVQAGLVSVIRIGNRPLPVELTAIYENNDTIKVRKNVSIWKDGNSEISIKLDKSDGLKKLFLNTFLPDLDKSNNYFIANEARLDIDLNEYEGKFELNQNAVAQVSAGDYHLILRSSGTGNEYLLLPLENDVFETPDGTFTMEFIRDQLGKVVMYNGNRFGNALSGERIN